MASPQALQSHPINLTCHQSSAATHSKNPKLHRCFTRRTAALATVFLATDAIVGPGSASSFQLQFTAPDQTPEEADAGVKVHAEELLQIKSLIDSESWREAQVTLRESASYLKQDLSTIIQAKPRSQRPQLRKLYSNLFNSVTRLDYAARSKDTSLVQECYQNIKAILEDILARI